MKKIHLNHWHNVNHKTVPAAESNS